MKVTEPFHRARRAKATAFSAMPPRAPLRRPMRIARQLALAHAMQARIDSGEVRGRAELARSLGLSRARVTQLMDLLLLAPDIQEAILMQEVPAGRDAVSEHGVRRVLRHVDWRAQRVEWRSIWSNRGEAVPMY